jgi:hypothetical protein
MFLDSLKTNKINTLDTLVHLSSVNATKMFLNVLDGKWIKH